MSCLSGFQSQQIYQYSINNYKQVVTDFINLMSKNNKTIDVSALQRQKEKGNFHKILTKEEQRQLENMFDESELQNYFINAQGKVPFETIELAGLMYAEEGSKNVAKQIKQGVLEVNDEPDILDQQFLKQKISIEQEKALSLKLKKSEIDQKLKYLQLQTSPYLNMKMSRVNPEFSEQLRPPNVMSKQDHEAYIQKLLKSREQRDKKHKQIVDKLEKSIKEQQEKLKIMKSEKTNKQKQKRRMQIEKNLQKKKEQHKKMVEQQIKSRQEYKKVKNKEFLHQKIEARFQSEVLIPALEQKKKKLKQIRQMSRAFDVKDLIQHQKQYIEKRNQSFSAAKSKVNEDWNYKPPEKKERLRQVLEEEKLEQRKKLEQKKRQIEEKIQRQANFIDYLKERFVPKVDENKQKEMEQRLTSIKKPKRRESSYDPKTIGISYLQQAKRLKKEVPQRPQTQKNSSISLQKQSQKNQTDYLTQHRKQPQYYEQKRRKRLQNLLNSSTSENQKIKKLHQESQKINEAYSRKHELAKLKKQDIDEQDDALQLLLNGIKAKMGIIQLYNHNHKRSAAL